MGTKEETGAKSDLHSDRSNALSQDAYIYGTKGVGLIKGVFVVIFVIVGWEFGSWMCKGGSLRLQAGCNITHEACELD